MSEKYKIRDSQQLYFVSFATVNWIDVFTRRLYNDIFVDSLRYCQQHKGLEIYAWCLMTNHAHLIISSEADNLSSILRDLKRHTAKALLRAIEENQQESRREWMLWMFERAGRRNATTPNTSSGSRETTPSNSTPTSFVNSGFGTCTKIPWWLASWTRRKIFSTAVPAITPTAPA